MGVGRREGGGGRTRWKAPGGPHIQAQHTPGLLCCSRCRYFTVHPLLRGLTPASSRLCSSICCAPDTASRVHSTEEKKQEKKTKRQQGEIPQSFRRRKRRYIFTITITSKGRQGRRLLRAKHLYIYIYICSNNGCVCVLCFTSMMSILSATSPNLGRICMLFVYALRSQVW